VSAYCLPANAFSHRSQKLGLSSLFFKWSNHLFQDDSDVQQLSTLAESSLCISLQQRVTNCLGNPVLPTTHGKATYTGKIPTVHHSLTDDDSYDDLQLFPDIGRLAMVETHYQGNWTVSIAVPLSSEGSNNSQQQGQKEW
jgi:hypothetical protein